MPKIQRFRNQRFVQGSQVGQIENVVTAGKSGRALQNLGNQVARIGGQMADYQAQKNKADMVNAMQSFKGRAELISQDAEAKALTSPDLKEDGSNLVEIFTQQFAGIYDEINQLKGAERQGALRAVEAPFLRRRQAMVDQAVKMEIAAVFSQGEQNTETLGQVLINEPERYLEMRNDGLNYISQLPTGEKNQKAMVNEMNKALVSSALQGYYDRGQFEEARQAIKAEMSDVVGERRDELLKEIDRQEMSYVKKEAMKQNKAERDAIKQTERDKVTNLVRSLGALSSDDPEKQDLAFEQAQSFVDSGIYKQSYLDAMRVQDEDVNKQVSDVTFNSFDKRLEQNIGMQSFVDDVMESVAEHNLSPFQAQMLLADFGRTGLNNEKKSPMDKSFYTEAKQVANQILRNTFPTDIMSSGWDPANEGLRAKAAERAFVLRRQNMDPIKAMARAIKDVSPRKLNKTTNLETLKAKREDLFKKASNAEGQTKADLIAQFNKLDREIEVLEAQGEADE